MEQIDKISKFRYMRKNEYFKTLCHKVAEFETQIIEKL